MTQEIITIINLINANKFSYAKKLLKLNRQNIEDTAYHYLDNLIKENEYFYKLKDTEKGIILTHSLEKGKEYLNIGKINQAIEIFKQGYKKLKEPTFLYYLGICYYKICKFDEAIIYFEEYVKLSFMYLESCYLYLSRSYGLLQKNDSQLNKKSYIEKEKENKNLYLIYKSLNRGI